MEKKSGVSELMQASMELAGMRPSLRILKVLEWKIFQNKKIIHAAISVSPEMKDLYQDLRCILSDEDADMEMMALLQEKLKNGSMTVEHVK